MGTCDAEPLSGAVLNRMGMAGRRLKRMLLIVMYRAEQNKITHMWVEMDRDGLGAKKASAKESKSAREKRGLSWQSTPFRDQTAAMTAAMTTATRCSGKYVTYHCALIRIDHMWQRCLVPVNMITPTRRDLSTFGSRPTLGRRPLWTTSC